MERLFAASEEERQEGGSLFSDTEQAPKEEGGKRSTGKDFSADLQAFLQDSFDSSMEEQLEQRKQQRNLPPDKQVKKRQRRPMAGLDALIRSTVDPRPQPGGPDQRPKRITLSFDPKKLEKLKSIARNQRTMLRDIIDEIVADYLDRYEEQKP